MWTFFKSKFTAGIRILLGIIFFILPGIYFVTRYALINPIVIAEGEENGLPKNRSYDLTKGATWQIFIVGLILIIGNSALGIVAGSFDTPTPGVYVFFLYSLRDTFFNLTGCLTTIAMYLFYCHLKVKDALENSGNEVELSELVLEAK